MFATKPVDGGNISRNTDTWLAVRCGQVPPEQDVYWRHKLMAIPCYDKFINKNITLPTKACPSAMLG